MITIGSQVVVTRIATEGVVTAFYYGTGYRRNLVQGVWLSTDAGRVPVRLRRGTEYTLPDGTVGRVVS
ncbi:hypothetical protein KIPE111705_46715 [Kibdelosporangium persicum]|uniref:hypothetical protein n=1 Tax=Kibdelosporangium persicum TaxID=2698649 RepID=UPI00156601BB|nr:hypothetical protein [Kibdelosporangium persicum]